jgi:hypothetical protein
MPVITILFLSFEARARAGAARSRRIDAAAITDDSDAASAASYNDMVGLETHSYASGFKFLADY